MHALWPTRVEPGTISLLRLYGPSFRTPSRERRRTGACPHGRRRARHCRGPSQARSPAVADALRRRSGGDLRRASEQQRSAEISRAVPGSTQQCSATVPSREDPLMNAMHPRNTDSRRGTLRLALSALALVLGLAFAPGIGMLSGAQHASAQADVTKLTQAQAASMLSAAGITWSSSGGCTTRNNSTCTSFDQINQATVQGAHNPEERQWLRPPHHRRHRGRPRERHLLALQRLQDRLQPQQLHRRLHQERLLLHRPARRRLPSVGGRLGQPLRGRGQPLGRHLLQLRLLVPQQATFAPSRRPARPLAAPAESPRTPSTRTSGRHTESRHRTPLLDGRTLPAAALVPEQNSGGTLCDPHKASGP